MNRATGLVVQEKVIAALGTMNGTKVLKNREAFAKELRVALAERLVDVWRSS